MSLNVPIAASGGLLPGGKTTGSLQDYLITMGL